MSYFIRGHCTTIINIKDVMLWRMTVKHAEVHA